jgi:hypothetical protein
LGKIAQHGFRLAWRPGNQADGVFEKYQNRRLEVLDVFNALKIKEIQQNAISLDSRQSAGTEQLYSLLHAINNRLQISFDYQKFYADDKE